MVEYGWDQTPTPDLGLDITKAPEDIQKLYKWVIEKRYGEDVASAYGQAMVLTGIIAKNAEAMSLFTSGKMDTLSTYVDAMLIELTNKDIISAPEIIASRDGEPTLSARLARDVSAVEDNKLDLDYLSGSPLSHYDASMGNDWTSIVQLLCDTAHHKIVLPNVGTMRLGKIQLSRSLHIDMNNNNISVIGDCLFAVTDELDYLTIENIGGVEFEDKLAVNTHHAFGNYSLDGVPTKSTTSFPSKFSSTFITHDVKDLRLINNDFGVGKVAIVGDNTNYRVTGCTWIHDDTTTSTPYYLYMTKGDNGSVPVHKKGGIVDECFFDVFLMESSNQDIIKMSGGINGATISNNYLRNNSPETIAQVDVFAGGRGMRFINNHLENVELHRKQTGGNHGMDGQPSDMYYDLISGNFTEFQEGFIGKQAYYCTGNLFTITNNQVVLRQEHVEGARAFQFNVLHDNSGIIDGQLSGALILSNNIVDSIIPSGFFAEFSGRNQNFPKYVSMIGNILRGGSVFMGGALSASVSVGNLWLDNPAGADFINARDLSVSSNNVASDPSVLNRGRVSDSSASSVVPSIPITSTSFVLDVSSQDVISIRGGIAGAKIINFDGGFNGRKITLINTSESVLTIENNTNVLLSGQTDLTFNVNPYSSISFIYYSNRWIELDRSVR